MNVPETSEAAEPSVLPIPSPSNGIPGAYTFDRLSLPFPVRLPVMTMVSASSGLVLGLAHGGQEAGMRFRAEHAHRLPNSQAGWFLYHKSKNYHIMLGGIMEGFRMARRVAGWTIVFVSMEEGVDRGRAAVMRSGRNIFYGQEAWEKNEAQVASNRDFASTMFAGLGTAGIFSAWNRFPMPTAVRIAKLGVKVGFAFGVAQDAIALLRGRRLGYVEFIKRNVFGVGSSREGHEAAALATP